MTIQAKNYQPDIMYGASLSVTNISAITDVASTTGDAVSYSASAITSGNAMHVTGSGATQLTAGNVISADGGASTVGACLYAVSTGAYTGVGSGDGLINVVGNALTSGYAVQVSATAQTTGHAIHVIGGGSNITAGGTLFYGTMGAATVGQGLFLTTTGTYTGTGVARISLTGATTGLGLTVVATAATLTTGRYISCNDTTNGEVFGVGANGHLHTLQGSAPSIATNSTGITACAIITGSADTAGGFTTTGTPQSGTVLTVTFGKTYTAAPKFVALTPLNAAAGNPNTVPYISSITATTFVITWPAAGTYAGTPSYAWYVIA